jgi:hypothetical protein
MEHNIRYDEAWELADRVSPLIRQVTGNTPLGDWYTFHVHNTSTEEASGTHKSSNTPMSAGGIPGSRRSKDKGGRTGSDNKDNTDHHFSSPHAGWLPHRDRPSAPASEGFRPDGSPRYTTVWIPLTDATPASSCLYFLPAGADPGYLKTGDQLEDIFVKPQSWQHITAQPMAAGGVICFSHRLLHWGSVAELGAPARIAMSFAYAEKTFEAPFFSAEYLPSPPIALRAALQAGQAIMYNDQVTCGVDENLSYHNIYVVFYQFSSLVHNVWVHL